MRVSPVGLAFVLAFVSWPGIARIVRGEVLSLRSREYVQAAITLGASGWQTFWRVTWPLSLPGVVSGTVLVFVLTISDTRAPETDVSGRAIVEQPGMFTLAVLVTLIFFLVAGISAFSFWRSRSLENLR